MNKCLSWKAEIDFFRLTALGKGVDGVEKSNKKRKWTHRHGQQCGDHGAGVGGGGRGDGGISGNGSNKIKNELLKIPNNLKSYYSITILI